MRPFSSGNPGGRRREIREFYAFEGKASQDLQLPSHLDKLSRVGVKPRPCVLTYLHLHLQPSRPQQGLVYQVRPVGHT